MALIKCPDCGQDISEKAEKCIHCGNILVKEKKEEKLCSECGKEVPVEATVCSFCGCPFENKNTISDKQSKSMFKILIPIALIIIAIVIGVIIYSTSINSGKIEEEVLSTQEMEQVDSIREKIADLENQKTYIQKDLDEIKTQYDGLNDNQKKLIDNYGVLENIIDTPTEVEKSAITVCEHIKKSLRNPNSLILEEVLCKEPEKDSSSYYLTLNFSAQNGFGGYQSVYTAYTYDGEKGTAHGDAFSDAVSRVHLRFYSENTNKSIELDVKRIEKFLNE